MKEESDVGSQNVPKQNKAVQLFTDSDQDLRKFESWYITDILKYLTHSLPQSPDVFRYIFDIPELGGPDEIKQLFYKEFTWLSHLSRALEKCVCFIGVESPMKVNHFIFGIIVDDSMLIINPVGLTRNSDFYAYLGVDGEKKEASSEEKPKITIKEIGKLKHIYLSSLEFQKDKDGYFSCGPICLELMRHISHLPFKILLKCFENWREKTLQHVDITELLPDSLKELLKLEGSEYQKKVLAIRKMHLELLKAPTGNDKSTIEEQNECLDNYAGAFEQTLIIDLPNIDLSNEEEVYSPNKLRTHGKYSSFWLKKNYLEAIVQGKKTEVEDLFKISPLLLNVLNFKGYTSLMLAIQCNKEDIVNFLLEKNASLDDAGATVHKDIEDFAKFLGRKAFAELLFNKKKEKLASLSSDEELAKKLQEKEYQVSKAKIGSSPSSLNRKPSQPVSSMELENKGHEISEEELEFNVNKAQEKFDICLSKIRQTVPPEVQELNLKDLINWLKTNKPKLAKELLEYQRSSTALAPRIKSSKNSGQYQQDDKYTKEEAEKLKTDISKRKILEDEAELNQKLSQKGQVVGQFGNYILFRSNKVIINLPDKKEGIIFDDVQELKAFLKEKRESDKYYECHNYDSNSKKLLISFKEKDSDYENATKSIIDVEKGKHKSREERNKKLIKKIKRNIKVVKETKKELELDIKSCKKIYEVRNNLNCRTIIDRITCLMAAFTSLINSKKETINNYAYLTNLYWSDFELLGRLTYDKHHQNIFQYYYLGLVFLLDKILQEVVRVEELWNIISDIENKKKNSNFNNYRSKEFIQRDSLIENIIVKENEYKNKRTMERNQLMQNFVKKEGIFLEFVNIEKLCRAVKSYESLLKIKETIGWLNLINKSYDFSTLQKEAILNKLGQIGEYITSKRLSNFIKDKKPHINWQKYIDLRDFIEHQVEKGCQHILDLESKQFKQIIGDLSLLENEVAALLREIEPNLDNFIVEMVTDKETAASTKKEPLPYDGKILRKYLSIKIVSDQDLFEFLKQGYPLEKEKFDMILLKLTLFKDFKILIDSIIKSISQKILDESTKNIEEIFGKNSDNNLNDIIQLNLLLSTAKNRKEEELIKIFLREKRGWLKEKQLNMLRKFLNKDPQTKLVDSIRDNYFVIKRDLEELSKEIEEIIKILEPFQEWQSLCRVGCVKAWFQNKDICFESVQNISLLLENNGYTEILVQYATVRKKPNLDELKDIYNKLSANFSAEEKKLFMEFMFTVCQLKPITKLVNDLKRGSIKIKIPITSIIDSAIIFIQRVETLLHDMLHNEEFMKKVFNKVRKHFSGFKGAFNSLSDEDMKILGELYEEADGKKFDDLSEDMRKKQTQKYIKSGLYEKIEENWRSKGKIDKLEIIEEYYRIYEAKISEVLKADEVFEQALQYNLKQAIELLRDICKSSILGDSTFLKNKYNVLIKHRNYLAHDDDYIIEILETTPNPHIIYLGHVANIISLELKQLQSSPSYRKECQPAIPAEKSDNTLNSLAKPAQGNVSQLIVSANSPVFKEKSVNNTSLASQTTNLTNLHFNCN